MLKSYQRNLIVIAFMLAVAIWIVWPDNPGIHIGDFEKEIETRLTCRKSGSQLSLFEG